MEAPMLAALTVLVLLFLMNAASALIIVCEPNEVVVLSGFGGRNAAGERRGYRVLHAGWAFRWPFVERSDRLDMRLMPIDITVENAYSEGSIPLTIRAIANVKLASDPRLLGNAMERFLGMPRSEIEMVARQTLEGNLRTVLATMTPEEVNQDRLTFSQKTQEEVGEDLSKLGLVVDTLKIQNVSDSVDYLASISRTAVARVKREASVAESDAERAIGAAEARAQANIQVAEQKAQEAISKKENALATLVAERNGEYMAEVERTEAAGRQAKAQAERRLQELRAKLAELRLEAEVVLPARAEETAGRLRAEGDSAMITERGLATADAFRLMTETFERSGESAREVFMMQKLEDILRGVVARVREVEAGEVTLVDGAGGAALREYAAAYPAMVRGVLKEFEATLGVDLTGYLSGEATPADPGAGGPAGTPASGGRAIGFATADAAADAAEEALGETGPEEILDLVSREVARLGSLRDKQEKFLQRIGDLFGLDAATRDRVIAGACAEDRDGDEPAGQSPSTGSLYRKALRLAFRDGELSDAERTLLSKLAMALGLREETRLSVEDEVLGAARA